MEEMISIVVPVYNAGKTLHRCVDSLRGQIYRNIEIILVNDGSRDNSLELCRALAEEDSRIRVVDKPNGGVSSARNAGLDAAAGDFVMFCDSDDWVEPDWCSCLREHYTPESLTVCEIHREDVPRQEHPRQIQEVERRHYLHHRMLMCSPCNKLFSRDVIERDHIRFSRELSLGEDFVFCLEYLCGISGCVRFVYRELYHYDTTNETTLSSKAPALEQCDQFYRSMTDAMARLGAMDEESLLARDTLAAPHFERNLKVTARRKDLSFAEKMAVAGKIRSMESFRAMCRRGIRWGNPLYVWMLQHAWVQPAMLYLILREWAKGPENAAA